MKTTITFVSAWRDPATGKTHEGGSTAELDASVARVLIARGKAAEVPAEAPAEEAPAVDAAPAPETVQPDPEPEPAAPEEPTGPAKTAPAKRRSTNKEVAADG